MGGFEAESSDFVESPLRYHSDYFELLTVVRLSGNRTESGGQFDWGGRLLKSNGGAQRFPQGVWKSPVERKGIRELDCETDKSSRDESRT